MKKQTVAFDFDGVIHSYVTPWVSSEIIPDPPVSGIKEAIDSMRELVYKILLNLNCGIGSNSCEIER